MDLFARGYNELLELPSSEEARFAYGQPGRLSDDLRGMPQVPCVGDGDGQSRDCHGQLLDVPSVEEARDSHREHAEVPDDLPAVP